MYTKRQVGGEEREATRTMRWNWVVKEERREGVVRGEAAPTVPMRSFPRPAIRIE